MARSTYSPRNLSQQIEKEKYQTESENYKTKLLTSKSGALSCLQLGVKKSGTFPAFQETKAIITNSELDVE